MLFLHLLTTVIYWHVQIHVWDFEAHQLHIWESHIKIKNTVTGNLIIPSYEDSAYISACSLLEHRFGQTDPEVPDNLSHSVMSKELDSLFCF